MKRETLLERKRFAAELAERDARSKIPQVGPALDASCVEVVPTRQPDKARGKAGRTLLPPTDTEVLRRYRMRRWWLDRYSLTEIRELAECLR